MELLSNEKGDLKILSERLPPGDRIRFVSHEVEASDDEAAEFSTEPADYSVYPTAEGAEIAAVTDELALAA